jgi:hypothetical protein
MNEDMDKEFGELSGVAARLRRADFTGESRVKDALKERLLAKAEKKSRRSAFFWLVPAAAMAAALIMVTGRQAPRPEGGQAASYNLPSDLYADCGRQGLGDMLASERF